MKMFITIVLCMVTGLGVNGMGVQAATTSKEMNIYGIYLKTNDKGDSVLMESKGQYLLMDVGAYSNVAAIIEQLQKLKVTNIDIYLSHLHLDHIGGKSGDTMAGLEDIAGTGIKINKMYLPDPSLAPESVDYPGKYERLQKFMSDKGSIVYLKVGDTLQVGDVSGKVIGPLNVNKIHPKDYKDMPASEDGGNEELAMYTYYENNCSLATMFTCGNTKFFTVGDALEDEANFLVKKYSKALDADIIKLSHHGTGSGNTEELMAAVTPSYGFASNTGCADINKETKKWRTNIARKNVTNTGMCYLIGNQKKTIIYQVKDDAIKLYQNRISEATMLKGWVKLVGADGEFRKFDRYYFDTNGVTLKGVQKIDDNYFYLGKGGCMEYGNYNEAGKYQYWKSYGNKKRYFAYTDDKEFAVMAKGFQKVGSTMYYFDQDGYRLTGNGKTELVQIGKYKYGVGKSGALVKGTWATIGRDKYYFGTNCRMVSNTKVKVGKNYYYFGKDGKMVRAAKGTKLVKIGKYKYGVGKSGALVKNRWASVGKDKYYFDKTCKMATKLKIKIGRDYYYFGSNGKMARNQKIKTKTSSYYFGKSGAMYRNRYVRISKVKYYCANNGRMKICK